MFIKIHRFAKSNNIFRNKIAQYDCDLSDVNVLWKFSTLNDTARFAAGDNLGTVFDDSQQPGIQDL